VGVSEGSGLLGLAIVMSIFWSRNVVGLDVSSTLGFDCGSGLGE
jgi:hypothetical protein